MHFFPASNWGRLSFSRLGGCISSSWEHFGQVAFRFWCMSPTTSAVIPRRATAGRLLQQNRFPKGTHLLIHETSRGLSARPFCSATRCLLSTRASAALHALLIPCMFTFAWSQVAARITQRQLPANRRTVSVCGTSIGCQVDSYRCPMVLNPLNPAAGDVPIPEDPREVEAALRAGPITHRIFPYICWRYGDRGRKFTQSDSAWLAWLVRHEQSRMKEQVLWLRSVLSNRGMPSWILEIHLLNLHEQLVRSLPEKRSHYEKLVAASNHLRQQRHDCGQHLSHLCTC